MFGMRAYWPALLAYHYRTLSGSATGSREHHSPKLAAPLSSDSWRRKLPIKHSPAVSQLRMNPNGIPPREKELHTAVQSCCTPALVTACLDGMSEYSEAG